MVIDNESNLSRLFPYFGKAGGEQLTVPLVVNLKTIGILHVSGKQDGVFTEDDLELLEFLSTHVSMQIENARLVQNEQERRLRLQNIMIHQQELVKKDHRGGESIRDHQNRQLHFRLFGFSIRSASAAAVSSCYEGRTAIAAQFAASR